MRSGLLQNISGIIDLLYPNLCIACELESVPTDELFCLLCESKISNTKLHELEENDCTRRVVGVPVFRAAAMFRFYPGGVIQKVIHAVKYKGRPQVATRIGIRYGKLLAQNEWIKNVDLIIPVPLHIRKLRQRGFNQSSYFSCGLAQTLQKPVLENNLLRSISTTTQTLKGRYERLQNMKGAFQCADIQSLANKHVLLVDDVLTTGATVEACLMALQNIPGIQMSFITIAIAE